MAGKCIGTFIGRSQHQGVQTVTDRKNITFINTSGTASCFHIVDVIMGEGNFFIKTAVFQDDQGSKYFCDTGPGNKAGLRF